MGHIFPSAKKIQFNLKFEIFIENSSATPHKLPWNIHQEMSQFEKEVKIMKVQSLFSILFLILKGAVPYSPNVKGHPNWGES